jgi:hypothetical protein
MRCAASLLSQRRGVCRAADLTHVVAILRVRGLSSNASGYVDCPAGKLACLGAVSD